ncbi:calcium-binding protein [Enterovibrio norvegicus]|uniref:calcium-binding protein n=1 Tax=Enterovibrio norvegicus TaxID=188144 RepID=UPI0013D263B3|nr:calcium-binding protein [Enterovibrio norvegicus]
MTTIIQGTESDDTLRGTKGVDFIYGNDGDDFIQGDGDVDFIYGGDGNDTVIGGDHTDEVHGDAGDDWVRGGLQDDKVYGGTGNDLVEGGLGNDLVSGGEGDDRLFGNEGNDTISGGEGRDIVRAGDDDDVVSGGTGNDVLFGENGNDVIEGNDDNDVIWGGEGNDRLFGGSENGESGDGETPDSSDAEPIYQKSTPGTSSTFTTNDGDIITMTSADNGGLNGINGHHYQTVEGVFEGYYMGTNPGTWTDSHTHVLSEEVNGLRVTVGYMTYSEQIWFKLDGVEISLADGISNGTISISNLSGDNDDFINEAGHLQSRDVDTRDYTTIDIDMPFTTLEVLSSGHSGGISYEIYLNTEAKTVPHSDGNDSLYGAEGTDYIDGGTGDDYIDGGIDNDTLIGGEGSDTLLGREGVDIISGDAGNDTVYAGDDDDIVSGGAGIDELWGDKGDDFIEGNTGDDVIWGGEGNDRLFGGDEGEPQVPAPSEPAYQKSTPGSSSEFTTTTGDTITMTSVDNGGLNGINGNHYQTVQGVFEGYYMGTNPGTWTDSHTHVLSEEANGLRIKVGYMTYSEQIWFKLDGVEISLADGIANGTISISNLSGDNDDFINEAGHLQSRDVDTRDYTTIDIDIPFTTLEVMSSGHSGGISYEIYVDTTPVVPADGNDTIYGQAGDDIIDGGSGNDDLNGGADNDTIEGGYGNDVVHGDEGDDLLFGDEGNDKLYGDEGQDVIHGGAGSDVINAGEGNDRAFGGDGDDRIIGRWGDDTLKGDGGNDLIRGEWGQDRLFGGTGNDELHGGGDYDVIKGEEGDDLIVGGEGNDYLWGGEGSDVFYFDTSANGGSDNIFDFEKGVDVIEIHGSYSTGMNDVTYWAHDANTTAFHFGNSNSSIVLHDFSIDQVSADIFDFT